MRGIAMSTAENEKIEDRYIAIGLALLIGMGSAFLTLILSIVMMPHPPNTITGKIAWEINGLKNKVMNGDPHLKEDVAGAFNDVATLLGAGVAITAKRKPRPF